MVSPWTSPFVVQAHDDCVRALVRVTALDIQVSLRNPTAMLEDGMTSVETLYNKCKFLAPQQQLKSCFYWWCVKFPLLNDHKQYYITHTKIVP